MKPQLLSPLLVLLLSTLLFSCRDKDKDEAKPEEQPTTTTLLIGTWKISFFASDDNGNKQLDEFEKEFFDPQIDGDGTITFYSNGSGKSVLEEPGLEPEEDFFNWSLSNNNTLKIIESYTYFNGTDSVTQYDTSESIIKTLNTSSLLLEQRFVDTFFGTNETFIEWSGLERVK